MRRDGEQRKTSSVVRTRAKELRKTQTVAERLLWRVLRDRAVNGLKFRRQHPLDGFVLDFFCPEVKLCVELDGGVHDTQQERDAERTAHLQARGVRVIRFRNEEVEEDMPSVLRRIARAAARPLTSSTAADAWPASGETRPERASAAVPAGQYPAPAPLPTGQKPAS